MALALLAGTAGCDAGKRDVATYEGPSVAITRVNVGPGRPLPEGGAIEVAFDRYLLPTTVTRQSIAIVDGSNEPLPARLLPVVTYDPIARTATLAPPTIPWLTKGQVYKLVLGVPKGDSDLGGVRAIDRATLSQAAERVFAFVVDEPSGNTKAPSPIVFCRDVMPIFQAKCARSGCHGDDSAAASGLVLATAEGIAKTAFGRVANGARTGALDLTPSPPGRVFGLDMPRIDPGNPGNSWLLYKVELAPLPDEATLAAPPNITCTNGPSSAREREDDGTEVPVASASDAERARLGDHVLGSAMPFPTLDTLDSRGYPTQALTFDERELLRRWIAELSPNATLDACGACRAQ